MVKALALGADAVLLGRPYIWGLAVGGEAGVVAVLRALLAELDLTIGLSGHTRPGQLHPALLVREGAAERAPANHRGVPTVCDSHRGYVRGRPLHQTLSGRTKHRFPVSLRRQSISHRGR